MNDPNKTPATPLLLTRELRCVSVAIISGNIHWHIAEFTHPGDIPGTDGFSLDESLVKLTVPAGSIIPGDFYVLSLTGSVTAREREKENHNESRFADL